MRKILWSVLLATLSMQAGEVYATFSVEAKQSADLAFTSTGIVDEVMVDVSSVVRKNDTLVQLQNDDLEASLSAASIALKYAKRDYERQLKVKQLIDAPKLDSYAFNYENAKAQMQLQQAMFDKTILRAPFDGVIYEKSVEVGDAVSGAMLRTILKIQSVHERKLVLEFDQKYWNDVEVGQTFNYTVDGDAMVYSGSITKVYPYANNTNRKMRAEVKAEDFVVGLFGKGYISIPDAQDGTQAPEVK